MRISREGSERRRRERINGGREHRRNVRLSDDELVFLEAAARMAGMTVPSYLVACAVGKRARGGLSVAQCEALASEVLGAKRLLRRAGENFNRLTRIAHSQGAVPAEVPAAAAAVAEYARRLCVVAEGLRDPKVAGGRP